MEVITSLKNSKVSLVASLKNKKSREEYGLFIVEGKRSVQDAIVNGFKIKYIFCTENNLILLDELNYQYQNGSEVIIVTQNIMKKICDTESPQGIIAVLNIFEKEFTGDGPCLLLDRISDPGNLGTIFRTASACGVKNIFICSGTDAYSPKVVRSSMGGINFLNIYSKYKSEEVLTILKKFDYKIISADMNGVNLFDINKDAINFTKAAIIIGNEANGIEDFLIKKSDLIVSLPMENVESLNAAVCASVILYNFKYKK